MNIDEMTKSQLKERAIHVQRLYDSLCIASNDLEKRNNHLLAEVDILNKKLEYAQQAVDIAKQNMREALLSANEIQNSMGTDIMVVQKENRSLREKIKELEEKLNDNNS